MKTIEVLNTPAEFALLRGRDLSRTVCVVFDVLRATSAMVTALANGAVGIVPVAKIAEALAWRAKSAEVLLAGEREGVRIRAAQTGSVDFDLGNSPREFTRAIVAGKIIVTTTTNGTRALRACVGAREILAGSFLNLSATLARVQALDAENILLIGSGTGEAEALEDTLAVGAAVRGLETPATELSPAALRAREIFSMHETDLLAAMPRASNGARLLANPALRDDVAVCLQRDVFNLVAQLDADGVVRRLEF
jgi:2-phosphosulfolactate phosphatase